MSISEKAHSINETDETAETSAQCPVAHGAFSQQKAARHIEVYARPIERDEQGVWQVHGFAEARAILRSNTTRQAGFNAEMISNIPGVINRPILYMEGKAHHQQRKQTARFFTPKTVGSSYRQFIEKLSDQLIGELQRKHRVDLSQLSLSLAVQVAAQVVGVTNSLLPGMDKRLDSFFHQTASLPERKPILPWKWLVALRQLFHHRQTVAFFWLDVKPAIRARKRYARED